MHRAAKWLAFRVCQSVEDNAFPLRPEPTTSAHAWRDASGARRRFDPRGGRPYKSVLQVLVSFASACGPSAIFDLKNPLALLAWRILTFHPLQRFLPRPQISLELLRLHCLENFTKLWPRL